MPTYQVLTRLPTPEHGCETVRITASGASLVAEYECLEETRSEGTLRFSGVCAYRYTAENFAVSGLAIGSDVLVAVSNSEWVAELSRVDSLHPDDLKEAVHFAVWFSNSGYLEIIATKWQDDGLRQIS